MTKAVGELLINDYSRKGYIDGRAARLPTVIQQLRDRNRQARRYCWDDWRRADGKGSGEIRLPNCNSKPDRRASCDLNP